MKESDLMRLIQIHASKLGARLLRNNVGAFQDKNDQWIKFGLGVGTSDLIGWRTKIVSSDMVGKPIAIFTAIEVKSESGRLTAEQKNFIEAVKQSGGIAIVARSTDDIEGEFGN